MTNDSLKGITTDSNDSENNQVKQDHAELFISHPHTYKEYADVLARRIEGWSNRLVRVHQTSNAGRNPISVGDAIRPRLEKFLRRSCVVLVIYVDAKSAAYCMWEAGVAIARGDQPFTATKLVVFQLGNETPSVFKDDLLVRLDLESIENFAFDFHRSPDFFSSLGKPIAQELSTDELRTRAKQLFDELMSVHEELTPKPPPKPPEPVKYSRWIEFKVSIDESYANKLYKLANPEDSYDEKGPTPLQQAITEGKSLIEEHCLIEKYPLHLLAHFNMAEVVRGTKFVIFHNRWKDFLREPKNSSIRQYLKLDWWNELCEQITLALAAYPANEIQIPVKSVREENTWYIPAVTHKTILPVEKKVILTIALIRIPSNGRLISVDTSEFVGGNETQRVYPENESSGPD